jgi:hypothetical protein
MKNTKKILNECNFWSMRNFNFSLRFLDSAWKIGPSSEIFRPSHSLFQKLHGEIYILKIWVKMVIQHVTVLVDIDGIKSDKKSVILHIFMIFNSLSIGWFNFFIGCVVELILFPMKSLSKTWKYIDRWLLGHSFVCE